MALRPIIQHELSSSQTSIELSNIPQNYTDLVIYAQLRTDYSSDEDTALVIVNGSSANQSSRILYGDGSNDSATNQTIIRFAEATGATATADTFSTSRLFIPNYASSTLTKMFNLEATTHKFGPDAYQFITTSKWNQTSPITSLEMVPRFGSNFVAKSLVIVYAIIADTDGTTVVS